MHPITNHTKKSSLIIGIILCCFTNAYTQSRVGIGTTQPTATLDVNGSVRFNTGNAQAGRVLTATNSQGDAAWRPLTATAPLVAFAATGSAPGGPSNFPNDNKMYRVPFSGMDYNFGSHYTGWTNQPGYNVFTVPVAGVYAFDVQVRWVNNGSSFASMAIALIYEAPNGVKTELAGNFTANVAGGNPYFCQSLRGHFSLLPGYKVYVEVKNGSSGARSIENSRLTFFNGHLARAL